MHSKVIDAWVQAKTQCTNCDTRTCAMKSANPSPCYVRRLPCGPGAPGRALSLQLLQSQMTTQAPWIFEAHPSTFTSIRYCTSIDIVHGALATLVSRSTGCGTCLRAAPRRRCWPPATAACR